MIIQLVDKFCHMTLFVTLEIMTRLEKIPIFYTYLWLRENGTPYYVGKGKGDRAFIKKEHTYNPPPKERILIQEFPCETDAFSAEIFFISYYGRLDLGTGCLRNLTDGGEGVVNISLETRRKISERNIGNKHNLGNKRSLETRHKHSVALIGNTRAKGCKRSEETRRKMSESAKNISKEVRQKMAAAMKGIPKSLECREKLSKAKTGI